MKKKDIEKYWSQAKPYWQQFLKAARAFFSVRRNQIATGVLATVF